MSEINQFRGDTQIMPGTIDYRQLKDNAEIRLYQLEETVRALILAGATGTVPIEIEIFEITEAFLLSRTIVLSRTPVENSVNVYYRGVMLYQGNDYAFTVVDSDVYFNVNLELFLGDSLYIKYNYIPI